MCSYLNFIPNIYINTLKAPGKKLLSVRYSYLSLDKDAGCTKHRKEHKETNLFEIQEFQQQGSTRDQFT